MNSVLVSLGFGIITASTLLQGCRGLHPAVQRHRSAQYRVRRPDDVRRIHRVCVHPGGPEHLGGNGGGRAVRGGDLGAAEQVHAYAVRPPRHDLLRHDRRDDRPRPAGRVHGGTDLGAAAGQLPADVVRGRACRAHLIHPLATGRPGDRRAVRNRHPRTAALHQGRQGDPGSRRQPQPGAQQRHLRPADNRPGVAGVRADGRGRRRHAGAQPVQRLLHHGRHVPHGDHRRGRARRGRPGVRGHARRPGDRHPARGERDRARRCLRTDQRVRRSHPSAAHPADGDHGGAAKAKGVA